MQNATPGSTVTVYKLSRYQHVSDIELLLDDHYDRVERQAIATEFYRLMVEVIVKTFNLRERVRYTHTGDLVYYSFGEVCDNSSTTTILFDYTLTLFERINRHFARLGLENFVHYRLVSSSSTLLHSYDHIKIDFEATANWLAIRQWDGVRQNDDVNQRKENIAQVVSENPTQEQLDALYDGTAADHHNQH